MPMPMPTPENSTKGLVSGICFNARSVRNKMVDLVSYLQCKPINIVCISETRLNENCDSNELEMPVDCVMFRRDRQTKHGHGNAARSHNNGGGAVKSSLSPRRLTQLEHSELKEIYVEISLRGFKWMVTVIYRPPDANAEYWDFLQSNIDAIQSVSAEWKCLN